MRIAYARFIDDPDGTLCLKYRKLYVLKYHEHCALTNELLTPIIHKSKRPARILAQMHKANQIGWEPYDLGAAVQGFLRGDFS